MASLQFGKALSGTTAKGISINVTTLCSRDRPVGVLTKVLSVFFVVAAAAGSARYYSEVLEDGGLLRYVRDPSFLKICRELEAIKNRRVLVFETHPWQTPWLCYHARHNYVYFEGRFISDSALSPLDPLAKVPDLANFDFIVTRDQIVDLKAPIVFPPGACQ
jgi:hypothetical protein